MLKLIGVLFAVGAISILPVKVVNGRINEKNDCVMTYSFSREIVNENEDETVENEYSFLSSPLSFWDGCGSTYDIATVYTPNGSEVEVLIDKRTMSQTDINNCNSNGNKKVPQATLIADSTNKYNCHSYAWYQQSTDKPYWMNDPSKYYTDGSYYRTYTPKINDRICYFDKSGNNLHSGIIIDKYSGVSNSVCGDADMYKVVSKWGAWGLYEHRGDQCPYTSSCGGDALSVRYYHRHNFQNSYSNTNTSQHIAYCICGESITENHNNTYSNKTVTGHTALCACGKREVQTHLWTMYTNPNWGGPYTYVECKACHFIKRLGDNEFVPVRPYLVKNNKETI